MIKQIQSGKTTQKPLLCGTGRRESQVSAGAEWPGSGLVTELCTAQLAEWLPYKTIDKPDAAENVIGRGRSREI